MIGFNFGLVRGLLRAGLACASVWSAFSVQACATSSHAFRLNPEQEPEQYRVTCKKRFYYCEAEAKEQCGGEYQELARISNRPEQTLVKDSDLSSTGPAKGQAMWEGELTVQCGRLLPPLVLERPAQEPEPLPVPVTAPPGAPTAVPGERACIPGTTQACLGPGACGGAQACLESGAGFGPCDCGPNPAGSPAPADPPSGENQGPRAWATPPGAGAPANHPGHAMAGQINSLSAPGAD